MSDCDRQGWPEDLPPDGTLPCYECPLSHQGSRIIWGEGNQAANTYVILDNPGARENRSGQPFVCGTRQTLHETVASVGLSEADVYVTYVLKRRPLRAYDKPLERARCLPNLWRQISLCEPKVLVCLGDVATQAVFDDPSVSVKTLRGDWHTWRGWRIAVSYHPLAVRRRPVLAPLFAADWRMVADFLHGGGIPHTR